MACRPSIVVGVIGVETFYGRFMGTFRTLDALATLAFDFPSGRRNRSAFFRDELEQLLVLGQRGKARRRPGRGLATPALWGCRSSCRAA